MENLNDRKSEFYQEYKFSRLLPFQYLRDCKTCIKMELYIEILNRTISCLIYKIIEAITDFDIVGNINKRMTAANWLGAVKDIWGTAVYTPPEQLNHKKGILHILNLNGCILHLESLCMEVLSEVNILLALLKNLKKSGRVLWKDKNNKFSSLTHFLGLISILSGWDHHP